ncbi:MAG TPA: cytochrome c3 family protein [Candidatus Anammoximicrobium sp.]|nr:cytochrome c3 family protein [Candidatus Anammoximicrobium sp.]
MSHFRQPALRRHSALLLLAVAACILFLTRTDSPPASAGDEAGGAKAPPLPALKVDRSAPLLLDEPPAKEAKSQTFLRINDACFVCHGNYREEPMAVSHAKNEVSCIDCHDASLAHRNDEDNVTPPDKMYPVAKIDASCAECHDTHDVPAREVLKRWQERCPQKTDFAQIVCTDCHGNHRLARRTVRWDKQTGALLTRTPGPAPAQP